MSCIRCDNSTRYSEFKCEPNSVRWADSSGAFSMLAMGQIGMSNLKAVSKRVSFLIVILQQTMHLKGDCKSEFKESKLMNGVI